MKPKLPTRICNSWYHHRWFRVLLLLVGIDMFLFGVGFALGFNLLIFFEGISGFITRGIIGIAYVVVAGYLMKHALSYDKLKQETYLLCQHCAQEGVHADE